VSDGVQQYVAAVANNVHGTDEVVVFRQRLLGLVEKIAYSSTIKKALIARRPGPYPISKRSIIEIHAGQ
jgi:hypothetical protein